MAALLAQLPGPINLRLVLSDIKFADILHDLLTAKGNRSGVPRVLAVDRNETRELAGTLHIEGTSKDDAIAQIRAINALVTVGTTLTLQSRDATNPVTLNVLPSRGVSQPLDELFELPGGPVRPSFGAASPAGSSWPRDYTKATYTPGRAVVALRFDDGTGTGGDWDIVVPMLAERGLVGGFAVASHNVDGTHSPEYLSPAQLAKMESLGNEIMCHSDHHAADPATFAVFYNETVGARNLLRAMGLNVVSFVQPGSWTTTYNIDPDYGWTVGCAADLLLRANFAAYEGYLYGGPQVLPLPTEQRYGYCPRPAETEAGTISEVDQVIALGAAGTPSGVTLLFHSNTIVPGMGLASFGTVLDYIAAKVASGDITVLTPTQILYAVPS